MDSRYIEGLSLEQRLAHVVEECGEVLQAAGKCQRWGFLSVNPELDEEDQETNINWLSRELKDLEGAVERLVKQFGTDL